MDNLLNGFNGIDQQVLEAPPTDAGTPLPTDHSKLLESLPPDALDVMARVVELLHAGEPLADVELYAKLELARLERAKSKQEATPATEPDDAPQKP